MRELKFRLIKSGKIVGYEWHKATKKGRIQLLHSKDNKKWKLIFDGLSSYCGWVDHDHKDQYTGLKDKNGKGDWVDDIVEVKFGPVTYRRRIFQGESGAFCINLPSMSYTSPEGGPFPLWGIAHTNIGNIHENPNLLPPKEKE